MAFEPHPPVMRERSTARAARHSTRVPFTPAVTSTVVGEATFDFADANQGTFSYVVDGIAQAKPITRLMFSTSAPRCAAGSPSASTTYQALWWASPPGIESGWRVSIAHQGDILFAVWFTYDGAGRPTWFAMPNGVKSGEGIFSGALYRATRPTFDANPWSPNRVTLSDAGSATFSFSDGNSGDLHLRRWARVPGEADHAAILRHAGHGLTIERFFLMNRLLVLVGSLVVLITCFAVATTAHAERERIYHIGVVARDTPLAQLLNSRSTRAFVESLRERGWVDGKNIRIHWRSVEDHLDIAPAVIRELLGLRVDVLLVSGNAVAEEALKQTKSVPIFAYAMEPNDLIERKLIASIAKPGGNLTGLSAATSLEMNGKWLSIMKEIAPRISRVAYLIAWYAPPSWTMEREPRMGEIARKLGISLLDQRFGSAGDIEAAFENAVRRGADAILVPYWTPFLQRDNLLKVHRAAERYRVPVIYAVRGSSDSGGLATIADDNRPRWRRAAHYVDRMLKGTRPGDIPIEQIDTYELVINLKAAAAIGLTVPSSVIIQADRVIR